LQYNVFVIRKVQLVPLEAGKLILPQASVENKVSFYDASNLSFRDLYYTPPTVPVEEQLVTLQNKTETIDVKALPPVPSIGNADFSGAIGNFDAAIAIKENKITTNTTTHLLFIIEGVGSIQQVKAPVIRWPKGIESFEATEQNEEDKSGFPVKFKKTFSFPFLADKKGTYTFPAVEFTYFDANANRYITKATRAFTLPVAQGKKSFFRTLKKSNGEDEFQSRLYILLGGAVAVILIGLIWFNGKQKPQIQLAAATTIKKEEEQEEIKKPDSSAFLYAIRELQPNDDSSFFYKQLSKNLHSYIHSKYNIEAQELPSYIEQHPELATSLYQFKDLADNCSLGMYTPVYTIEQAMQHRLEAIEVLSKLENN
ncbi:MAG TPA: BatD family protein, partial [Segetibacter sp.]|nr:BatD family protein [Segetibacter sp.]